MLTMLCQTYKYAAPSSTIPRSPNGGETDRMRPTAVPTVSQDELTSYRLDPRQAVREHDIVCLVCGGVFRQLTNTHIASHQMTSVEYKLEHGYNLGRALMCHAL